MTAIIGAGGLAAADEDPEKSKKKSRSGRRRSGPDWKEFKQSMIDKYGKPTGVVATNISKKYVEKVEDDKMSEEEALEKIPEKIASHPKATDIETPDDLVETAEKKSSSDDVTKIPAGGEEA